MSDRKARILAAFSRKLDLLPTKELENLANNLESKLGSTGIEEFLTLWGRTPEIVSMDAAMTVVREVNELAQRIAARRGR